MTCPHCKIPMRSIEASGHYDTTVLLDQCPKCGGLWFDQDELYKIQQGEAAMLDVINKRELQALTELSNERLICPKDGTPLSEFSDYNFPKDLHVDWCRTCGGFWLNRGEFLEYQKSRQEKEPAAEKDQQLQDSVSRLLAADSNTESYETLGRLSQFLSQPIGHTRKKSAFHGSSEAVFLEIVLALLRLFIKS